MKRRPGFTIIELLIVIAIIVVLAMITIFAFGNWRVRTARTEMKNELQAVGASLQNYLNFNNSYPAALDSSVKYKANPNIKLTYTLRADKKSYCLSAQNTAVASEPPYYLDSKQGTPTKTPCT